MINCNVNKNNLVLNHLYFFSYQAAFGLTHKYAVCVRAHVAQ